MNLMELLPVYYRGNHSVEEIQGALSIEIDNLSNRFGESLDQCFINTATSLLGRYEEIYGIKVDVSKSDEFRRERIRAKIRGIGTVTKQMIIDTAAAYSGGEVDVMEHPETNSFIVKFIGVLGIPANMADLIVTIEEIKPAHLNYTFEYTYRRWGELISNLWDDVANKTWYQLSTE